MSDSIREIIDDMQNVLPELGNREAYDLIQYYMDRLKALEKQALMTSV